MFEYTFQWRPVFAVWQELAGGALVTIQLTILSMLFGTAIAMCLAVGRTLRNPIIYGVSTAWVETARNTPALLQIYLAYFGLGAFGLHLEPYTAVLGALTFINAGYMAEILRGGFAAVGRWQMAAAQSLGMNRLQGFLYVVFPQVFRAVFWPSTNQVIYMMLGSSLGMIIGLHELTGVANYHQSLTFRTFEFFLVIAVMYYVIARLMILSARLLAVRLFRY
jgi:polar amino acid transport system permease protein